MAGAINAVAGGGSFVAFPALVLIGVPPVPANATNTLALWVGTVATGGAYRQKLTIYRGVLRPLVVASVLGGFAGALLMIKTPPQTFVHVLPWLMLGATLLFAFGKSLSGRISSGISHESSPQAVGAAAIFQFCAAVYGGYFGGGLGIVMLAMLSALGMKDIHAMNKLKVMLAMVINGVAAVTFVAARQIYWPQAGVMMGGAILGGYASAYYAQKLPQHWIRNFAIAVGAAMTVYFFYRGYR